MQRADLVAKLELVAPALSTNNIVAVMTHFWFTGEEIMAYNDTIAISVPCKTSFACAVPGLLLSLLKASRAKDIEFEYDAKERSLLCKGSGTRIKLGTMSEKDFAFSMPEIGDVATISANKDGFLGCVKNCLRSVSVDTSVSDYLGVTLIGEDDRLLFFSTNHSTLSHSWMGLPKATKFKRALLPTAFCTQLVNVVDDKSKSITLRIGSDHALVQGRDGVMLFTKLINSEKPIHFVKQFEQHYPEGSAKKLVAIPTKLQLILDRSCTVAAANVTPVLVSIKVTDGKARFDTKGTHAEVTDTVTLEDRHGDVTLRVDPKLIKNGYGDFTKMLLTSRAFIMVGTHSFYMVANSEG